MCNLVRVSFFCFALWSTFGALVQALPGQAGEPEPPMWPGRFHAMMWQYGDDDGDRGVVDLWYDYSAGRNLNIIQTQRGEEAGPLFDNERANGSTYYYLPAKGKSKYCNVIDSGVGIIKPDWLAGATFVRQEKSGIYDCYRWEQGKIPEAHARVLGWDRREGMGLVSQGSDLAVHGRKRPEEAFITYWSEVKTGRPVRWEFYIGLQFEVIRFDEGATMDDRIFQIPAYCFTDGELRAS